MNIAHQLTKLRKAKGLTQAQAARAADVSEAMIARLESGGRRLTRKMAARLRRLYGSDLDAAIGAHQLDLFLSAASAKRSDLGEVQAYLTEAAQRGENPDVWRAGDYLVIHTNGQEAQEAAEVTTT